MNEYPREGKAKCHHKPKLDTCYADVAVFRCTDCGRVVKYQYKNKYGDSYWEYQKDA